MRTKPRLIHSVHHRNARGTSDRSEPKVTRRSGPRARARHTHTHTRSLTRGKTPTPPHKATELRGRREIRTRSGRPRRDPAPIGAATVGSEGRLPVGRSVGGGGGDGRRGGIVGRPRRLSSRCPAKISMRAWEGGGEGRKLLGFGRHASSPPLLFIEAFASPSARWWLASDALPAAMRWWLFVFTFAGRMPFLIAPGACDCGARLDWESGG